MKNVVSDITLEKVHLYCNYLCLKIKVTCRTISSVQIANDIRLKPIQVRKNILDNVIIGKQKNNYNVHQLLNHLIEFLGSNKIRAVDETKAQIISSKCLLPLTLEKIS